MLHVNYGNSCKISCLRTKEEENEELLWLTGDAA